MWSSIFAPPTRREVTISLFGLCVFVLAYNLDSSLHAPSLDVPTSSSPAASNPDLYLDADLVLEQDGRRPAGWRDALEDEIFGTWAWPAGRVAVGIGKPPEGEGSHYQDDALWGERLRQRLDRGPVERTPDAEDLDKAGWGPASLNEGFVRWEGRMPETEVLTHTPGFTVLENVFFAEGVMYLISDNVSKLPPIAEIASSNENLDTAPRDADWRYITTAQAKERFRGMASLVQGTSWLATGPSSYQDSHTLLALWRLHSSLDPDISANGTTSLAPPLRLIFPHVPRYTAKSGELYPKAAIYPVRSYTGVHPLLAKAALPTLGALHFEDWDDFVAMPTPFAFQRVVLADRGAASRAIAAAGSAAPEWAGPFLDLRAGEHWFAPLRATLAGHLGVAPDGADTGSAGWGWKKGEERPVVVYVSKQLDAAGPKMRAEDHQKLVTALAKTGKDNGYETYVVDAKTPWEERMKAIVRATIVLGVTGEPLADGYYMRPSPRSTLMEFFPPNIFMRDMEIPMRSIGIKYVAWWHSRKFMQDKLPSVTFPENYASWTAQDISVDANAVMKMVREELSRN